MQFSQVLRSLKFRQKEKGKIVREIIGTNSNLLVQTLIKLRLYDLIEFIEIFKANDIGLQRYKDYKIRVCGDNSVPFYAVRNSKL